MSVITGGDIENLLLSQTQISMRNALQTYLDKRGTAGLSNSLNANSIASVTGTAGIDMQGLTSDEYLSDILMTVRSSIASMLFPSSASDSFDSIISAGSVSAASLFSSGSSGLDGYLVSGYENMFSGGMDMITKNPLDSIIAQANVSSMNVLDLLS